MTLIERLTKQLAAMPTDAKLAEDNLVAALDNFGADVPSRFDTGTPGQHELMDRAWIQYENWQTYVNKHPTNILIPEASALAHLIEELMSDYYQLVATAGVRGEEGQDAPCGPQGIEQAVTPAP